jgi:hypothetical protein
MKPGHLSRFSDELLAGRQKNWGSIPCVQTYSRAHPAFYQMGSSGARWQGREAEHSVPFNAEVKNGGAISPLPHTLSYHGV